MHIHSWGRKYLFFENLLMIFSELRWTVLEVEYILSMAYHMSFIYPILSLSHFLHTVYHSGLFEIIVQENNKICYVSCSSCFYTIYLTSLDWYSYSLFFRECFPDGHVLILFVLDHGFMLISHTVYYNSDLLKFLCSLNVSNRHRPSRIS